MQSYRNSSTPVHYVGMHPYRLVFCLALLGGGVPAGAETAPWKAAREVDGVAVESRPAPTGFDEFRGRVRVCTDLDGLQQFVGDPTRFSEWIPFTDRAHALPGEAGSDVERYYLRSTTPWPLRPRDLVYRLEREPAGTDGVLRIRLTGLPDAVPPSEDAVRMDGAEGQWTLRPDTGGIDVALQLAVDPGRVPAMFANRRMGITVGRMLANLRERFTCP